MPKLPKFYGIDVGKKTTKVVIANLEGKKPKITKALSFESGTGSLTADDPTKRDDMALRIKDTLAAAKLDTKKAVVALPEPVIFNRLLTFPALEEEELNQSIHWNAQQFLPVAIDDVQMDWIKIADLEQNGQKMIQLLLVAAPKKLIKQTAEVFKQAEQDLIAIETEAVATSRIIANAYPDDPSLLVVDVGSSGTDLSVVVKGNLIFSQSLGTGGDTFRSTLAKTYNIDDAQAQQYLEKFGMLPNEGEGKIFATLEPVMSIIYNELAKTINFFKSKYQQNTPQKILIVGEGAKVPGIAEYFAGKLGLVTELANLLNNLDIEGDAKNELSHSNVHSFAVALGLAIKTE